MKNEIKIGGRTLVSRGRSFVGTVIKDSMMSTVTVEWPRKYYNKKYQRYEKRRSRVKAHNPESINAKKGDVVRIVESRPISKTKHFVVSEILSGDNLSKDDSLTVDSKGSDVKSSTKVSSAVAAKKSRGVKGVGIRKETSASKNSVSDDGVVKKPTNKKVVVKKVKKE